MLDVSTHITISFLLIARSTYPACTRIMSGGFFWRFFIPSGKKYIYLILSLLLHFGLGARLFSMRYPAALCT